MAYESFFTGWGSFLAGILVLVSLFTSWHRKRDSLVGFIISDYSCGSSVDFIWQLGAIPTVGFSNPILSYFSALVLFFDGARMLKNGYESVIITS